MIFYWNNYYIFKDLLFGIIGIYWMNELILIDKLKFIFEFY